MFSENWLIFFFNVFKKDKFSFKIGLLRHSNISSEIKLNQSLKRDTALATAAIYESMFGTEDGTIPATFQVTSNSKL